MLAGCSGSGGTAATDTTTTDTSGTKATGGPTKSTTVVPPPDAPKVGECRKLTYTDIGLYSNDTLPSDCKDPHTSFTFSVPTLPADIAFEGVQIKNDAVQTAASQACRDAFMHYIGGSAATRALSRLTVTYFLPDQQGFDAGAHWVRCDVIAIQSSNSLGDLPNELAGILNDPSVLTKYGVCSRGTPGDASSLLVMCTQDHDFRALTAIRLGELDAPYPGEHVAAGHKGECEDFVANALGVTGGFTYAWTYPSSGDWADGQRFGYCWNESSS
jgi:Septum formation